MSAVLWLAAAAALSANALEKGLPDLDAPADVSGTHARAAAHWGLGMYETSAREFEQVVAALPGSAAALSNLALTRLAQGRCQDALPALERAAALAPGSPRARLLLGLCLSRLGRESEAAGQLRRAAALDPADPGLRLRLAERLQTSGRLDDAERELRRAVALSPDDGPALLRLGRLLESRGRPEQARPLLRRFAELGSSSRWPGPRYEVPWEPDATESSGPPGPHWIAVRPVADKPGRRPAVTVRSGSLSLRRSGSGPLRFSLGDRTVVDSIRVDWGDGTSSYKVEAGVDRELAIERSAARVW